MAKQGEKDNYRIPSASSAIVKAPRDIIKPQKAPKKTTGGDLRAK